VTSVLRERAIEYPSSVALTDLDVNYSWSQLADLCERGVRAFLSLGLNEGEKVAIIARNSATTALAYAIARYAGIPLVPISSHLTAGEIEYVLDDAQVAVVLCDESTRCAAEEAVSGAGCRLFDWGSSTDSTFMTWIRTFPVGSIDLTRRMVPNMLYTSGTTGFPKGVLHPKGLSMTIGEYIEAYREPSGAGPYLTVGPLYHAGPLGSIRRLTGGRELIVPPRFDPESVLAAIERFHVTGTTMVPTHFIRLLSLPDSVRRSYDVTSLRSVDHTGSSCPPSVKQAMIDWVGPILTERYGGTESGTVCTISSLDWLTHPGSVGRTDERFTALIVDDALRELDPGETGRIFFIDSTGEGIRYEGDEEKTAAAHLRPGVFTLGDVGHVDDDGYLFVDGRTGDTVISGGVNLYPAEIERVLLEHLSVADVAVLGIPDPVMGEQLRALIVPAHASLMISELEVHCRSRLAGPKRPRSFALVDELPRNAMGKLQRHLLADFDPWGGALSEPFLTKIEEDQDGTVIPNLVNAVVWRGNVRYSGSTRATQC